jgi:hypothetical protein
VGAPEVELRVSGPGLNAEQISSALSAQPTRVWRQSGDEYWSLRLPGHAADVAEEQIAAIVDVVERGGDALRRLRETGVTVVLTVRGYVGDGSSVRLTAGQVRALAAADVTLRVTGSTSDREETQAMWQNIKVSAHTPDGAEVPVNEAPADLDDDPRLELAPEQLAAIAPAGAGVTFVARTDRVGAEDELTAEFGWT